MTDSDGALKHLAFFEELGKMDEANANWRAVSAGLVTIRFVDNWIASGAGVCRADAWAVSAVRESIAEIGDALPVKRILKGVVDVVVSATSLNLHVLVPRLLAYAQALQYDDKWSLAADVCQTIVSHADPIVDSDLVVTAYLQLGFCLRSVGELDSAAAAYAHASEVALAAGDMIGVLRGRLGDARIAVARGNMPYAESIVDETIGRAEAHGLADVKSRALHDRAWIAGIRGHYDRAIKFSYEALEVAVTQQDRDRILGNIATGFRYLGLSDIARDAYLVLAATAQEQYVRWMAELNLMELAATQSVELQFDMYRRTLESADFSPPLRATYLLHVGRGYHALGKSESGIPYLERAIELAASHGLNHLLFEAEAALGDAKRNKRYVKPDADWQSAASVRHVIDAISDMRQTSGV